MGVLALMAGGYKFGEATMFSHAQMEVHRDAADEKGERNTNIFVNWQENLR